MIVDPENLNIVAPTEAERRVLRMLPGGSFITNAAQLSDNLGMLQDILGALTGDALNMFPEIMRDSLRDLASGTMPEVETMQSSVDGALANETSAMIARLEYELGEEGV